MNDWCKHILKCSRESHFVWMFEDGRPLPRKTIICPICKTKAPKYWRKIIKED